MNTQQELEFAQKVSKILDQGARELDAATATRLLEVRKEALAHFQKKPVHAWAPAWVSNTMGRIIEPFNSHLKSGFVLLVLLTALTAFVAWNTFSQQGSEVADLDQALLTDELPINAYLDKGFESWLKRP